MTPAALASIHAASFITPRPWSAAEFAGFLADPLCFLIPDPGGFALGRAVAGEAELLTIAVTPRKRRRGLGQRLLKAFLQDARARGADAAFLEVAANNPAAIGLYLAAGFARVGRRPGYYPTPDGAIDALCFRRDLVHQ